MPIWQNNTETQKIEVRLQKLNNIGEMTSSNMRKLGINIELYENNKIFNVFVKYAVK